MEECEIKAELLYCNCTLEEYFGGILATRKKQMDDYEVKKASKISKIMRQ